jgi:ectoine hydroxylase-related dioxygenase (phytanoyl-CoA dioxygenase family)
MILNTERTTETIPEQVEFYRENGYLIVHNVLQPNELETLLQEATHICSGDQGNFKGSKTLTGNETEDEILQKYLCIHYPHKFSDHMYRTVSHPAVVKVLTKIIGPNVKCMQSMLFIKASGRPGQAWHQDEDFIPTRDRSLTGAWIALDDATVRNGCLWVIPGSHRDGILWPLEVQTNTDFDCTSESSGFPYTDDDAVPVELPAGSAVFFNGYLLHRSLPNVTESSFRRAFVSHYMSASSLLPWRLPQENEYMAIADFRDIIMVAGQDPYAYKGLENINIPYVRPSGKGGCDTQADTE